MRRVMTSRPVKYFKNGTREAGLIAQEQVIAGYGEYVAVTPREGLPEQKRDGITFRADHALSLNYADVLAYTMAALQNALQRIAALEARP